MPQPVLYKYQGQDLDRDIHLITLVTPLAYVTSSYSTPFGKMWEDIVVGENDPVLGVWGYWEDKAASVKDPHFPHTCTKCKGPAYIGFTSTECKRGCK
jgi:hypothetical protein